MPNAYDMDEEWMAWRVVCKLLRERGVDVNNVEHDVLARAMRYYAQTWHALCLSDPQVKSQHAKADREATQALYPTLD